MTTTAKIAALSDCKDTGITHDHAKKMWPKLGSTHMAVVELQVGNRGEGLGDTKDVKLVINAVELADTAENAEHLRELQRALYMTRQPDKALTAGVESTPRDVVVRNQDLVLVCEKCERSLGAQNVNHGRRDGVQCIWVPCRHTVAPDEPKTCGCGMPT